MNSVVRISHLVKIERKKMNLDFLLQSVKDVVQQHTSQQSSGQGGLDPSALLGQIEGLFTQHATATRQNLPSIGHVLPASQDPLGDPADQEFRRFGNIKPASEDPLGDPADQRR